MSAARVRVCVRVRVRVCARLRVCASVCACVRLRAREFSRQANWRGVRAGVPGAESESFLECIQLAACDVDEALPTNPVFPADVFTGPSWVGRERWGGGGLPAPCLHP